MQRQEQREKVINLFNNYGVNDSDDENDDDDDDDANDQSILYQPTRSSPITTSSLPLEELKNYENDQFDDTYPIDDDLFDMDNSPPLFNDSSMSVKKAVHLLTSFFIDFNINKRAVIQLLRLIKSLLPNPNRLPTSWKSIMKILGYVSTARTAFLCSHCYKRCEKDRNGSKSCHNEECLLKNRTMKSNEIVELVHLDIRAQIQTILTRNQSLLNKKELYPTTDVCFGEHYQNQSRTSTNNITLILHTDGAPLVKLSKQNLWPCFASIVEIPPPARDYQKNIILLSLWTSKVKPNPNIFLHETIEELKLLINSGTSIFMNGKEYQINLRTQYFVSDLPAKALFCNTISFNGYSACTECCSKGMWVTLGKLIFLCT